MHTRMFDRAYSKTLSFDEDFETGPILNQDIALIYEKKLDYDPDFLYTIDYDFSCDVDVWGRVATNQYSIGSVHVTCVDLGICNRPHPFEAILKEDCQAASKFYGIIEKHIERKYKQGVHLD